VWRTCVMSSSPSVFCICRRMHTQMCTLMHTQMCSLMHTQMCAWEHCVYVHLCRYISAWYNKYIHIIYVYTYVHLCTPLHTYVRISIYHITVESGRPASRFCGPQCSAYAHSYTLGYVHWNTVYMYSYVHMCIHITGESERPASRRCGPRCSAYAHSCTFE